MDVYTLKQVPSEAQIQKYLRNIVFGKNIFCPVCKRRNTVYATQGRYRCTFCRIRFSLLSLNWLSNMKPLCKSSGFSSGVGLIKCRSNKQSFSVLSLRKLSDNGLRSSDTIFLRIKYSLNQWFSYMKILWGKKGVCTHHGETQRNQKTCVPYSTSHNAK